MEATRVSSPQRAFHRARDGPRLPIADMLFAVGPQGLQPMSGRRAMTDFRNAQAGGLLSTCPSFSTAFRYMEDPTLTPVLKSLIEQNGLPLKAV